MRYIKQLLILILVFNTIALPAQIIDSLNTAKHCSYMLEEEREMIYEINLVRSNPAGYIQYIQPILDRSVITLKTRGKGQRNYALTFTRSMINGKENVKIDTTWNYENEEELKALKSLVKDLKTMRAASVLQPDSGIYLAVQSFAADQDKHQWKLLHTGSAGDNPWDRISKFSPRMKAGNENGAGSTPKNNARETVIQLLVDAGIPRYGHPYNLLDKQWTHVACLSAGKKEGMWRWIQNFGRITQQK